MLGRHSIFVVAYTVFWYVLHDALVILVARISDVSNAGLD